MRWIVYKTTSVAYYNFKINGSAVVGGLNGVGQNGYTYGEDFEIYVAQNSGSNWKIGTLTGTFGSTTLADTYRSSVSDAYNNSGTYSVRSANNVDLIYEPADINKTYYIIGLKADANYKITQFP